MSLQQAIEKHATAVKDLREHIKQNAEIFNAHQRLVERTIDTDNDLRDQAIAEYGEVGGKESVSGFEVTITPQSQTWADIEIIDQLMVQGKIPNHLRPEIVKTQQRPPRITIREQKE